MQNTHQTPRMTIQELREFLDQGKDDYRIRSVKDEHGQLCLCIYRRSLLDSIKEKLFDKYRLKAQKARSEAHKGIEAVLGERLGGPEAAAAFENIKARLNKPGKDLRVRDLREQLKVLDPAHGKNAEQVSRVYGGWHGVVDRLGYETKASQADALRHLEQLVTAWQERAETIIDTTCTLVEDVTKQPAIRKGVPALLAFVSKQFTSDRTPTDFDAIDQLAGITWPDEEKLTDMDESLADAISFLHAFALATKQPSTRLLVVEGVNALLGELASAAATSRPGSVPELVAQLSSRDFRPPEWRLGDLLRPDTQLGQHPLSAASMSDKLLAVLAIAQDPGCLKRSGQLDMERTLGVISGWSKEYFPEHRQLLENRQSLQGIRFEPISGKLYVGRHDQLGIEMKKVQQIREALQKNQERAGVGVHQLTLDLSGIPQRSVKTDFNEAVLGDMHGNSVMFMHQLVQLGFAEIQPGKEKAWTALVEQIKSNDLTDFRARLADVLTLTSPDKNLVLLGDLLADRAHNDWFMLCMIDFLHQNKQKFDIIFSNHDATFVEYYLANKTARGDYHIRPQGTALRLAEDDSKSLMRLNEALNKQPELRERFGEMAENYLAHLNLISYNQDQQTLYAHAVVNQAMLSDMLKASVAADDNAGGLPLEQQVGKIQAHFQTSLNSIDQFRQLFGKPSEPGKANPFYLAIWNRGPFADNKSFSENLEHPYANALAPVGVQRCVHGHTDDMQAKRSTRHQREQIYRSLQSSLDASQLGEAQVPRSAAWLRSALQLLQVERHPANSANVLILALRDYLDQPSPAEGSGLRQRVATFLNDLKKEAIPKPDEASLTGWGKALGDLLRDLVQEEQTALPDQSRLNDLAAGMINFFRIMSMRSKAADNGERQSSEKSPAEQMRDLTHVAISGLAGDLFYGIEAAESDHMAAYRSLDAPFGKGDQDLAGHREIFLL